VALVSARDLILRNLAEKEIKNANYYAKILFVSWGKNTEGAYYGYGWSTDPEATVYNAARITKVDGGLI